MTQKPGTRCDSCGRTGPLTTEHWRIEPDKGIGPYELRALVRVEDLFLVRLCGRCKGDPWAESRACSRLLGR